MKKVVKSFALALFLLAGTSMGNGAIAASSVVVSLFVTPEYADGRFAGQQQREYYLYLYGNTADFQAIIDNDTENALNNAAASTTAADNDYWRGYAAGLNNRR